MMALYNKCGGNATRPPAAFRGKERIHTNMPQSDSILLSPSHARADAAQADPKLRLLLLGDYLFTNTDEAHTVTVPQLVAYLSERGVEADRRTVYADLARLSGYGYDIVKRRSRTHDYYLGARAFELAELKLLVDAVQSCRFLTESKSRLLIEKLSRLTSRHQAGGLERQVYVQNRAKTGNERVYYNVDSIHAAIQQTRKIRFRYCQYTLQKELRARRGGEPYVVSPYLLTWAEDNYYLVADHPAHDGLTHFRVDKMQDVAVLKDARTPTPAFLDPAAYVKSMFSMYAGSRAFVTMRFAAPLVGAVIDRFGADVPIVPESEQQAFTVRAQVSVSPAFFGWLLQFGGEAEILAPADVRAQMAAQLNAALRGYGAAAADGNGARL